jgi:hypothetical protein
MAINKLISFLRCKKGNVALIAAAVSPAIFGVAAVGVDYVLLNNQKTLLQNAADASALASVKELSLSGAQDEVIKQVGESYALAAFSVGDRTSNGHGSMSTEVLPDQELRQVKVNLSYQWKPFMAHLFDVGVTPIKVSATAKLAGSALTCIVGLMQPQRIAKSSIHLDNRSVINAGDCAVFSNSVSRYGLRADSRSKLSASNICSAGGVLEFGFGRSANFSPKPITDCPKIDDPLQDRQPPVVGSCNHESLIVSSNTRLEPGVYCGGLTIRNGAEVVFEPGIHTIKDGPFRVEDDASINAEKVTFFLTGDNSIIEFEENSTIDISAAETGSTAGLLFYEDRNVNYSFDFNPFFPNVRPSSVRLHRISSNNARNLLGTLYLSRSILLIDSNAPVADVSAYTAIITGRLWLKEGPTLTLNANYTDTEVPVPDGIMGNEPALIK